MLANLSELLAKAFGVDLLRLLRLLRFNPRSPGGRKGQQARFGVQGEITHDLDGTAMGRLGRLWDGSGTALTSKNINVYAVWDGGTAPDPRKPSLAPLNLNLNNLN